LSELGDALVLRNHADSVSRGPKLPGGGAREAARTQAWPKAEGRESHELNGQPGLFVASFAMVISDSENQKMPCPSFGWPNDDATNVAARVLLEVLSNGAT
jgi:hypothetical protein